MSIGAVRQRWLLAAGTLLLAASACGTSDPLRPCGAGVDCEPREISNLHIILSVSSGSVGFDTAIEIPTVEEVLETGFLTSGQSPVHIAVRAAIQGGTVRCDWHGIARTAERREEAIRFWLGIEEDAPDPSMEEAKRLFTSYVNAVEPSFRPMWMANVSAIVNGGLSTEYVFLTCYAQYTINENILGTGGSALTVVYDLASACRPIACTATPMLPEQSMARPN